MRYLVLGSGLQGRVVAYDIARHDESAEIVVADIDEENLKLTEELVGGEKIKTQVLDIFDEVALAEAMSNTDTVLVNLPNLIPETRAIYEALSKVQNKKCVFSDYWAWQFHRKYDEAMKENKNLVVPGLGIAPGFANICVGELANQFDTMDEAQIYVCGLPAERGVMPADYMEVFSMDSVLNMYCEEAHVIEDGRVETRPILTPYDKMFIPGYGEVEVFTTDGLNSLQKNLVDKGVRKARENTLRYPGHLEKMRLLRDLGLFSLDPIEVDGVELVPREVVAAILKRTWKKVPGVKDITYLKVIGKGSLNGKNVQKEYELMTNSDEEVGITSMEIATAYPVSIAGLLLANEATEGVYGVVDPELYFINENFIRLVEELAKRGVIVYER